ncbi:pilin [Amycolatopsis sp. NPDC059657]|uniref:pilin n=1 Tax=Amycolatopsis sp. NPDC059657 TaxID=3346899 RepID=UPI00366CF4E9
MFSGSARSRRAVRRRLAAITQLAALGLVLSASAARADTVQVLSLAGSVDEVLDNIRKYVMGILAGLATVFLTIGGVRYVFGGGDPGEIEKAKTSFKAAGIGYALAALAPLVVTVLKGIVGA